MSEEEALKRQRRKTGRGPGKSGSPDSAAAGWRSWTSAALGAFVLVLGGFLLGLALGVVSEEPEVVASHMVGQGDEVIWDSAAAPGEVSAAPPRDATAEESTALEPLQVAEQPGESQAPQRVPPAAALPVSAAPAVPSVSAAPRQPRATADQANVGASREAGAPSAVPAAPATGTVPARGWAVQVGAFSRSSSADALAESLRDKGFDTYLTPSAGSTDGRWRVRVGPLESQSEARRLAQRLEREESLSTWVLSEGGG